jgi:anaerobic C4-dicarboxylate transporter
VGVFQHFLYRKKGGRTPVSHIHIWFGRIVLICAAVNGGLGLKLAAMTASNKAGQIAFGVIAGVMAVFYALTVLLKRKSGENVVKDEGINLREAPL